AFRHGRLVGMAALWNQRLFRHLIPARAESIPLEDDGSSRYLHCLLAEDDDPAVAAALLRGINAALPVPIVAHGGLDVSDPLLPGLREFLCGTRVTRHFLMTYGRNPCPGLAPGPFHLDAARC